MEEFILKLWNYKKHLMETIMEKINDQTAKFAGE